MKTMFDKNVVLESRGESPLRDFVSGGDFGAERGCEGSGLGQGT